MTITDEKSFFSEHRYVRALEAVAPLALNFVLAALHLHYNNGTVQNTGFPVKLQNHFQ